MHEAMLSQKLANSNVQCNICQWRCHISPGNAGVCRMYQNIDGSLLNMNYALASSVAIDPIEKKPLYHFYPGSQVFSLGSWRCNFHCEGCQNWQISCTEIAPPGKGSQEITPAQAVQMAQSNSCRGIAWTYNEPSMWFEYTLDSAKLAKHNNLYTVYVTNGYMSPEALDDDEQLQGIAGWIHDKLGELTPWHVTRFYPQYQATHLMPTPISTLERALEIGKKAGLKFIYTGNVPGHDGENTYCYSCSKMVVQRSGYNTRVIGLAGSKCKFCGAELNFRV